MWNAEMMSKYVKRFECDLLARGAMVSVGGRCNLLIERLMLDSTLVHNPHLTQTIPALLETSQLLCRFSQWGCPPPLTNKIWQESYRLIGICLLPHPPPIFYKLYLEIISPRKKITWGIDFAQRDLFYSFNFRGRISHRLRGRKSER